MRQQYEAAKTLYRQYFGSDPALVAVAPGRVNLIGEHVDHQGYSVLPAALNQTIEVAVGTGKEALSDCILEIRHKDPALFPPVIFKSLDEIKVANVPHWTNYIIASLLGIFEYATHNSISHVGQCVKPYSHPTGDVLYTAKKLFPATGLKLCMDGRVPLSAGVSSSSAAVVASTLALTNILNVSMSREVLAGICAHSERHVGTAGGGMDQAAICLSKPGTARHIHFFPLRTEIVPLPSSGVIIVSNTGREAPKALSAATCYNKRVFELKLACYMILRAEFPHEAIPKEKIPTLTLREVQEKLNVSLQKAAEIAKQHIFPGRLSKEEVDKILGQENRECLISSRVGPAVWELNIHFEPLSRALHVFSEAQRVHDFVSICRDDKMDEEEKLKKLGVLLNSSDRSLTIDYECGCPELVEITSLARSLGAYGSRLTGAGWGGCTVSLVHKDKVEAFMKGMQAYYERSDRLIPIDIPTPLERALFAVVPGDGANIFDGKGNQLTWS